MPTAAKKKTAKRRPPRKRGRPSLLAKKRPAILRALGEAIPIRSACLQAGVNERTLRLWIAKGREELNALAIWEEAEPEVRAPEPPPVTELGEFVEAVEIAEAQAEAKLVRKVAKEKPLEILKRRFPDSWGDTRRVKLEGGDPDSPIVTENLGGPPVVFNLTLEDPDDEELWEDATDEEGDEE